jgi:hypothetical protein
VTSHRTTTKILLTALLITLTTGTAAAQSIEIVSPSDGSYHNESFDIVTEVSSLDSDTKYDVVFSTEGNSHTESDISSGELEISSTDIGGFTTSETAYNLSAELQASGTEVDNGSIQVTYDEEDPYLDGDTQTETLGDGTVEISAQIADDHSYLSMFKLERNGEIVDSTSTGGPDVSETLVDKNEDHVYGEVSYNIIIVDNAGNTVNTSWTGNPVSINDSTAPSIVDRYPEEDAYISSDSPNLNVDVEDLLSGLKNATLTVDGNSTNFTVSDSEVESEELQLELESLDEGVYSPEVTAYDQEGNSETYDWAFTVDTQKPDPSASLSPSPDGQEYLTTATPLQVEVDEEDVSPTNVERITCYVDDPSDYNNDFGSSSEYSDGSFRCGELDPSSYSEGSHSIYVEFYDRAGNKQVSNLGEYVFDTVNPEIETLTVTPEYTNTEPSVTVEASDFGSGVEDAEYMFSEDVDDGEGNTISEGFEDGDMSFQPNLRNKEDGDYELFVRVQDGSGKWSDTRSVNFTLDRGALPDPELETEGTLHITSGSSTGFEVTINNNGKVPLTSAELRFLDGIEGSLNSVDVEGESEETVSVIASTNRSYGQIETTLKLTTDSVSENVTVPVNIRASEEQKQEVNERIKQYESRLRYLKANMTKLEEDGADQELIDQMDAEIGDFEERLQQINASIAEDRYYEIASSIDEVESQRSEAVNTTETVKEQHRQNEQRFWMILFTVSTLGILGGGAFVWYRSDYYLDTDDLPVDLENISFEDIEWDETVEKLEDKLDNLLEGDGGQKPSEDSRDLSWD